ERERGMLGAIAISNDGRLAATGNWDGVIKVWDIQRSTCITKIVRPGVKNPHHGTAIQSLAFSPDNQHLAATGSRCEIVYTWDPRTGTPLATFHDPQRETRSLYPTLRRPVAFSPDSRLLACTAPAGATDGPDVVLVWDVVSGACTACLTEQPSFVRSLCFSPCGQTLAIGGSKGTVQVWSVNTWEQEGVYQNYDDTSRMSVCYSQEGVLHATENALESGTVVVWDVERHEKRYTYVEREWEIEEALFSRSSHFVVAGGKEWAVWSPGDTKPRKVPHSHVGFPNSVTFSQDGKKVAAGCVGYGSTFFWDIANPMQPPTFFKISDDPWAVSVFTSEKIHSTAFAYDENTVKITVKIGEADENTTPMTLTLPDPEAVVTTAAHAPLRHLIACGDSKGRLYVWDMRNSDITHTLPLEGDWDDDRISRLIFSHDGKHLVSVPSSSGTMATLWDIDTGKEILGFRVNRVDTVAFSPCGHKIASGMATEIRLWDVHNCRTLLTLPHAPTNGNPRALAFSPCGQYLASGAWWNRGVETEKVPIRLWEVATGKNIATFWGHPTDVQDIAFSPDGTLLASGSFDSTILLWDLKSVIGS
ncbi:hypothetical protein C6503_13920, partial [Candidatus Poribacteria bacterium]